MKKIGLALAVLAILALLSVVALADDCESENARDYTEANLPIANDLVTSNINIVLAANCIEKGLQCTLNGTPCCSPYECKGKFPNTYCK